jgi:hypothetical protein
MQTVAHTQDVTTVFEAAKSLPPKVREQLVEGVWASLNDDAPCEPSQLEAMQLEEDRKDLRSGL